MYFFIPNEPVSAKAFKATTRRETPHAKKTTKAFVFTPSFCPPLLSFTARANKQPTLIPASGRVSLPRADGTLERQVGGFRVAAANSPAVQGHGGSPEAEQRLVPRRGRRVWRYTRKCRKISVWPRAITQHGLRLPGRCYYTIGVAIGRALFALQG